MVDIGRRDYQETGAYVAPAFKARATGFLACRPYAAGIGATADIDPISDRGLGETPRTLVEEGEHDPHVIRPAELAHLVERCHFPRVTCWPTNERRCDRPGFVDHFRRTPDHPVRRTSAWRRLATQTVDSPA